MKIKSLPYRMRLWKKALTIFVNRMKFIIRELGKYWSRKFSYRKRREQKKNWRLKISRVSCLLAGTHERVDLSGWGKLIENIIFYSLNLSFDKFINPLPQKIIMPLAITMRLQSRVLYHPQKFCSFFFGLAVAVEKLEDNQDVFLLCVQGEIFFCVS